MGPSGGPRCHGADGRDAEAPERPRDKGALCPRPSGLCSWARRSRAPFTRSLATAETAAGCRKERGREGARPAPGC